MTNARPWPNAAASARDRAAEEANRGLRALRPLLEDRVVTREENTRRAAVAIDSLQTIARLMEQSGAQTLP